MPSKDELDRSRNLFSPLRLPLLIAILAPTPPLVVRVNGAGEKGYAGPWTPQPHHGRLPDGGHPRSG